MNNEKLYTPKEAATALDVSVATVHRWIKWGIIPAYQIRRTVRIAVKDINTLLKASKSINANSPSEEGLSPQV